MTISYAEAIAQCAEHIAAHDAHGYSQPNRKGHGSEELAFSDGTPYSVHKGDYDCSEMARTCAEAAGLLSPDSYMWTGNEDAVLKNAGFKEVKLSAKRRGDILWKQGHTGVYLGGGMMADAHGDEYGGIDGPHEGDQTGHEIEVRPVGSCSWERCYRPPAGNVEAAEAPQAPSIANGIDVSNWQEGGGAQAIRDTACGFAIVKASEGTWFADKYAKANADAAIAAGKLLGYYHFARRESAEAEAEWFVAKCQEAGHLDVATLWLDYEGEAIANGPAWAERFMRRVDELTGKTCGIYMSQSETLAQEWAASAHRPLWVAQYASDDPVYGWQDEPWATGVFGAWGSRCAIHQYTGDGHVPGYDGALDLDRGWFTVDEWALWASQKPADVAPAPEEPQEPEKPADEPTESDKGYEMITPMTFVFTTPVNIRKGPGLSYPTIDGEECYYRVGESVTVDGLQVADGYVWAHYVGATSGEDRWVALGPLAYVSEV